MSERSEITISAKFLFWVLTLGCIGGLFIGAYLGALRGRAEQKKWDDSYYANRTELKHDVELVIGTCHWQAQYKIEIHEPARSVIDSCWPAKASKPRP